MTSVLVINAGRYRDVAVNGQRIARYPDDQSAHQAARLIRHSLTETGIIPWGLLPQPTRWLGAPYHDNNDGPRDVAGAYDGIGTVYSDADPGL